MKTFLIQTVDNQIVHDFAFYLREAIKYHNWYYNEQVYNYILSETPERPKLNDYQYYSLNDIIPIGTVEFVSEYLKKYYNIQNIKPLNIPQELMQEKYLKRWVKYQLNESNVFNAGEKLIFVKDNAKIKGFTNIIEPTKGYPKGEYLISEVVDIESEWRCFIYNGEFVGLQNYLGNFTLFPNIKLIKEMISRYKDCPPAYTLDIGINKIGETFILEVHNFFACGLYGFSDHRVLPQMFIKAFNWQLNK